MDLEGVPASAPAVALPHRVGEGVDLSNTHTRLSVKHTSLGSFKQLRLLAKADNFRLRAAAVCVRNTPDDDVEVGSCPMRRLQFSHHALAGMPDQLCEPVKIRCLEDARRWH